MTFPEDYKTRLVIYDHKRVRNPVKRNPVKR